MLCLTFQSLGSQLWKTLLSWWGLAITGPLLQLRNAGKGKLLSRVIPSFQVLRFFSCMWQSLVTRAVTITFKGSFLHINVFNAYLLCSILFLMTSDLISHNIIFRLSWLVIFECQDRLGARIDLIIGDSILMYGPPVAFLFGILRFKTNYRSSFSYFLL